jgi:hypothetical protein
MSHTLTIDRVRAHFRAVEDGVDAAVPVDAKTAPTSDLENCKDRSFRQRPHRLFFSGKKKTEERTTKQKLQVCQSDCLNGGVHPRKLCPRLCPNACLPSTSTVTYGQTPRDISPELSR